MNCDWMKNSIGLSFHWTSHSALNGGGHLSYEDAVNAFDVPRFVDSLVSVGATHCLFTLTHAEQKLAFPCEPLQRLLPGRVTQRDLIGEIAQALHDNGIRFIAYYNHSCNGNDDTAWKTACGYDAGVRGDLDAFAENICAIVRFASLRYGKLLDGWWFDSAYSVDPKGPHNTITCEMGDWQFPWEKLYRAAKSGNESSAVAVNAGIGSNFLYTPFQDYYAGETVRLDEPFTPQEVENMIGHRWITLDNTAWVFAQDAAAQGFSQPRFSTEAVTDFIASNLAHGRMTTFNVEIDQTGLVNPHSLAQVSKAVQSLK